MIDRKTWTAATVIALACATAALAQNTDEAGLRARDKAAVDKVRALIEADKAHPRIGGIWVIAAPSQSLFLTCVPTR